MEKYDTEKTVPFQGHIALKFMNNRSFMVDSRVDIVPLPGTIHGGTLLHSYSEAMNTSCGVDKDLEKNREEEDSWRKLIFSFIPYYISQNVLIGIMENA